MLPHVDSLTIDGQLIEAAQKGDVDTLTTLLDKHPDKLHVRTKPYEWSLHLAAHNGHRAAVDLLLKRGLDVNTREKGDNTYAMHRAAAPGHLDVVRRLADAGGDVVGRGDDHALEVIGWATCWDGTDERHHVASLARCCGSVDVTSSRSRMMTRALAAIVRTTRSPVETAPPKGDT